LFLLNSNETDAEVKGAATVHDKINSKCIDRRHISCYFNSSSSGFLANCTRYCTQ